MKKVDKKIITKTNTKTKPVASPVIKTVRFFNKNIKISPRKLRLLANTIKKLKPSVALTQLKFINTRSARALHQAVQSVIADAQNNHQLNPQTLVFDQIMVDQGPRFKRMDKSHSSRFARGLIQKRHSRLLISVKGNNK